jgi:lysophospholipase L1-like esterase
MGATKGGARATVVVLAAVAALSVAALSACGGDDASAESPDSPDRSELVTTVETGAPPTTVATTAAAAPIPYYLSLGDSYASGYEAGIGNTDNGFAYQVVDETAAASHPLVLVNFGCGGATTTSVLEAEGCSPDGLGPGAEPYEGQTQLEAAETFIREHPGEIGLITLSIGGNDVTACGIAADPVACVTAAVEGISTNVPVILQRLRAAAGPEPLIVGTTYPDVILGQWLDGTPEAQQLAELSVTAFKELINPALAKAYTEAGGTFVDVTEATGAYGPMTELTPLAPYGDIPLPVAKVCELTYYCSEGDIHPNADGYQVIADLVVDAYLSSVGGQATG